MVASMLTIRALIAAGIAIGAFSGSSLAAPEELTTQFLVNRSETAVSETDGVADHEQFRRYFLQAR
jgi:hypothetical protein